MVETRQQPPASSANGGLAKNTFCADIPAGKFGNALVYLLILGLITRIGYFIEHSHDDSFGMPTLDQTYYDTVARMILAGDDLHQLHGFHTLLYPMFLAAIYKIGGTGGVPLAIAVQHLLGIGTGLLVALLGARVFRNRLCGVIGGALFLLSPIPLSFEGELLVESSYLFLICAGLLVLFHAAETSDWKGGLLWIGGGALMELAAQARANILIFMAVYPLFVFWIWWQTRTRKSWLPLLGLVGVMAMMILWGYINLRQSDVLLFMPSQGGVNLYLGNKHTADGMTAEQERAVSYDQRYQDSVEVWSQQEYADAMRAQGRQPSADPREASHYWTQRAIDEIKAHPGTWARLMVKKFWLMLWNREVPNNKAFTFQQEQFVWLHWLPIRWVVLLCLAPLGLWAAWKWGNRNAGFILLVFLFFYWASNLLFFISDRYRYPLWPAMAVFAGGGVMHLLAIIRARKTTAISSALAVMAMLATLSLHNWFHAELPTFARDYFFKSLAEFDKGHFKPALADIDRSVSLDPTDVNAAVHQGNVLFALGRLDEARNAYERATKINPNEPSAWANLGNALDAQGKTDEALQAFSNAMHCTPPSRNAFLGTAYIQIRRGQLDAATKTLDELQAVTGGQNVLALAARSVIERRRGNIQAAGELEQQVNRLDSSAISWVLKQIEGKDSNSSGK